MISFRNSLKKKNILKYYKKILINISYSNIKGYKKLKSSLFFKKALNKGKKKLKKYRLKIYRSKLKRKKYIKNITKKFESLKKNYKLQKTYTYISQLKRQYKKKTLKLKELDRIPTKKIIKYIIRQRKQKDLILKTKSEIVRKKKFLHFRHKKHSKRFKNYAKYQKLPFYKTKKRFSFTYKYINKKIKIKIKNTTNIISKKKACIDIPFLYVKPITLIRQQTNRGFSKKPRIFNFSARKETINHIYASIHKLFKTKEKIDNNLKIKLALKKKRLKKLLIINRKLIFISKNSYNNKALLFEKKQQQYFIKNTHFYFVKRIIWNIINIKYKQIHIKLQKLKANIGKHKFFQYFKKTFYLFIYHFKTLIISMIGLKKALKRKRKKKSRYITDIPLTIRDIKTKYILALLTIPYFNSFFLKYTQTPSSTNITWLHRLNNNLNLKKQLDNVKEKNTIRFNVGRDPFNEIINDVEIFYKNHYDFFFEKKENKNKKKLSLDEIQQDTFHYEKVSNFNEDQEIILNNYKKQLETKKNVSFPTKHDLTRILNLPKQFL